MKKSTKIWLITATALILAGGIIFGGALTMNHWNFSKLSTVKYETNRYEFDTEFKDITFAGNTADVVFVPSADGQTRVTCYEEKKEKHAVSVQDGALLIQLESAKKWYEYVEINFKVPKITVELPAGEYGALSLQASTGDVEISKDFTFESMAVSVSTGDVTSGSSVKGLAKIRATTGDISVSGFSAGSVELSVSTGKISVSELKCEGDVQLKVTTGKASLSNVECKNLISTGNTGGISLENVIAAEKFSIVRTTGKVKFERCDAAELFIKTGTGDVTGSLLSSKVFLCQTSTGNVKVPQTSTGGKCEIITSTGDIKVTLN